MSEQAYVALAVAGTFAAVLLVGVTAVTVSRTRRSAHVLQSQLESAGVQAVHGRLRGRRPVRHAGKDE